MKKLTIILVLLVVVLIQLMGVYGCFAWNSSNFNQEGKDIFDDWHVSRTTSLGEDGYLQETFTGRPEWPPSSFRPVIAFESLGEYVDTAYRLGEQAADEYPDRHQRAEKIFYFVRDRVRYSPDIDQFDLSEFAQNADEVATTIDENGIAYGDCEDMAILLAVMYKGAGYRSAIVDCPDHVGVIVYLPDYRRANVVFEFNGEEGWIWAEATGNTNPFGWFPQGQLGEPLLVYEISAESIPLWQPPEEEEPPPVPPEEEEPPPVSPATEDPNALMMILVFLVVVAVMGIIILLFTTIIRRRHRA